MTALPNVLFLPERILIMKLLYGEGKASFIELRDRLVIRDGNLVCMGKKLAMLITDGLPAYHDAFNKEYYTVKGPRTEHINAIKLSGNMNNNKMERFNGKVRDREKIMRNVKIKTTPILAGYQIYHNYIREHQGIANRTQHPHRRKSWNPSRGG